MRKGFCTQSALFVNYMYDVYDVYEYVSCTQLCHVCVIAKVLQSQ